MHVPIDVVGFDKPRYLLAETVTFDIFAEKEFSKLLVEGGYKRSTIVYAGDFDSEFFRTHSFYSTLSYKFPVGISIGTSLIFHKDIEDSGIQAFVWQPFVIRFNFAEYKKYRTKK